MKAPQFFIYSLTLMLIYLKLTSVIDWSWFLVLAPVLWPLMLVGVIMAAGIVIGGIVWLFESAEERKQRKVAEAFRRMSRHFR